MGEHFNNKTVGASSIVLSLQLNDIVNPDDRKYTVELDITVIPTTKLTDLAVLRREILRVSKEKSTIEELSGMVYRTVKAAYTGKEYSPKVEVIVTSKDFNGYNFVRVHTAG